MHLVVVDCLATVAILLIVDGEDDHIRAAEKKKWAGVR